MARVNFINAELSGKLAGTVYARNKAGAYVRNFRKPTNPNTTAQQNARSMFTGGLSGWGGLSAGEKSGWSAFAGSLFKPKSGKTGVAYSGFNAYVGLATVVRNATRGIRTVVAKSNITAGTLTYAEYDTTTTPPSLLLSSSIKSAAGAPLGITLLSATLDTHAALVVNLSLSASVATAPTFESYGTTEKVGFQFFISNAYPKTQQFVTNPTITLVAAVKPIATWTTWAAATTPLFSFSFTGADFNVGGTKTFPNAGDYVRVTAVLTGAKGQTQVLGNVEVQVT